MRSGSSGERSSFFFSSVWSSNRIKGSSESEVRSADQQQHEEDYVSQKSLSSRGRTQRLKVMECKVRLLDGSDYTCTVEKRAKGQVLFSKVCDHLNLLEEDYFGITYRDAENQKNWLDVSKEMKKQISTGPWNFAFNVKFYPPDPSQLSEDITRYFLCLQLRDDIVSGRLPCSFSTLTVLGSYTVQSELGDCDSELQGSSHLSDMRLAQNQTKELEEKVLELHRGYKGMNPAEADMLFLENAKKLSMYGVDLHCAKLLGRLFDCLAAVQEEDSEGVEIMLGVCSSGLLVYREKLRINRFAWPKILKISYKRNNFYIKVRPGELKHFESTIGFKLPNHKAAKRLWKVCVEHHTFFRLVSPEAPPKRFLSLGSKFRYSGRTQAQTRRASALITREAPQFQRSASRRNTVAPSMNSTPATVTRDDEKNDKPAVATDDLIAMETPEKKAEEMNSVEEENKVNSDESEQAPPPSVTKYSFIKRIKGENVFVKHSNLMLEETDTPTALVQHHLSVTEMKRLFLQMRCEASGVNEWDRRLSSSPRPDDPSLVKPVHSQEMSEEDKAESEDVPVQKDHAADGVEQSEEALKDVPVVHTETKTITYESAEVDASGDSDPGVLMSAQTITSENNSTTSTTHITKTVKDGISETHIEKRIVITGDADIDHDQALAQAIKEVKEQHPDMSVTKVVVHKESEISAADGDV
ncbi:protein 4.1 isoform X10 [Carassius auratus]|uniref:Protein 4.1 isoform X10 n=1 Tax=Carassius auratus TaxID=7957 RepID=A0A6P6QGM5_CARAU|nr:protein 4.1-like isoform X10 [Carassius auratus]